jgi:hypothetical protein
MSILQMASGKTQQTHAMGNCMKIIWKSDLLFKSFFSFLLAIFSANYKKDILVGLCIDFDSIDNVVANAVGAVVFI